MNSVSAYLPSTSPQPLARRVGNAAAVHTLGSFQPPHSDTSSKSAHAPLHGELISRPQHDALPQLRGIVIEGQRVRVDRALSAYRVNSTISPASVYSPGRLFNSHA